MIGNLSSQNVQQNALYGSGNAVTRMKTFLYFLVGN
jgi:hypothetical protein